MDRIPILLSHGHLVSGSFMVGSRLTTKEHNFLDVALVSGAPLWPLFILGKNVRTLVFGKTKELLINIMCNVKDLLKLPLMIVPCSDGHTVVVNGCQSPLKTFTLISFHESWFKVTEDNVKAAILLPSTCTT